MVGSNLLQAHGVLGAVKPVGLVALSRAVVGVAQGQGRLPTPSRLSPIWEHFSHPPRFTGTSGKD